MTKNNKHYYEEGHWRWRGHTSPKVIYDKSGKIKSSSLGYDPDLGAALLILQLDPCTHFQDTTKDEFLINGDRCKIELPLDGTFNGVRYVHKNKQSIRILYLPDSPK
tara:strand:- start:110 stop:430 length:321 start_codon:yes stop_codon:yes gene_type:complete